MSEQAFNIFSQLKVDEADAVKLITNDGKLSWLPPSLAACIIFLSQYRNHTPTQIYDYTHKLVFIANTDEDACKSLFSERIVKWCNDMYKTLYGFDIDIVIKNNIISIRNDSKTPSLLSSTTAVSARGVADNNNNNNNNNDTDCEDLSPMREQNLFGDESGERSSAGSIRAPDGGVSPQKSRKPQKVESIDWGGFIEERKKMFSDAKEARVKGEITVLDQLIGAIPPLPTTDIQPSSPAPSWASGGNMEEELKSKFETRKLSPQEAKENMIKRSSDSRQLEQDNSLDHTRDVKTHKYLQKLLMHDLFTRVYPDQPVQLSSMLNQRSDYIDAESLNYVVKCDEEKIRPGETSLIREREKFIEEKTQSYDIVVHGSVNEVVASCYVNLDIVNKVYQLQSIGRGFDTGSSTMHRTKEKIIRQLAEYQDFVSYKCKRGNMLESVLAVPSLRLRELTDGAMMFNIMSGDVVDAINSIFGKYVPHLEFTRSLDTWPKMDDWLRRYPVFAAMLHRKHEIGGVSLYLDYLLNDAAAYDGFYDMNKCPYEVLMRDMAVSIEQHMREEDTSDDDIYDGDDDTSDDDIYDDVGELLEGTADTYNPYFGPSDNTYANEAIEKLEAMHSDETIKPDATLFGGRYSNFNNIQNSGDAKIRAWGDEHLKTLLDIPGTEVSLRGGGGITTREMRLVLFDKKYLFLVRGSSFCAFDGKQNLKRALQFCMEYVNEAVFRYCVGLQNLDGLFHILDMMRSYAMLIAGPSGSVSNPGGSRYSPTHYILPDGVVGALDGAAGSKTAGAKAIEAVFNGKLHYYGILYLLHRFGMIKFNKLMKKMRSDLKVMLLYDDDSQSDVFVFQDGNGQYFDTHYDYIFAESCVLDTYECLEKLTEPMINYLLVNRDEQPASDGVDNIIECLNSAAMKLYGDCNKTNNEPRSTRLHTEKMIEHLQLHKKDNLIQVTYALERMHVKKRVKGNVASGNDKSAGHFQPVDTTLDGHIVTEDVGDGGYW